MYFHVYIASDIHCCDLIIAFCINTNCFPWRHQKFIIRIRIIIFDINQELFCIYLDISAISHITYSTQRNSIMKNTWRRHRWYSIGICFHI